MNQHENMVWWFVLFCDGHQTTSTPLIRSARHQAPGTDPFLWVRCVGPGAGPENTELINQDKLTKSVLCWGKAPQRRSTVREIDTLVYDSGVLLQNKTSDQLLDYCVWVLVSLVMWLYEFSGRWWRKKQRKFKLTFSCRTIKNAALSLRTESDINVILYVLSV